MAASHVPTGCRLLDVGSEEGFFLDMLEGRFSRAVGIDPVYKEVQHQDRRLMVPGRFPHDLEAVQGPFDVITMIAVLEHLPVDDLEGAARACSELLAPGGRVIITMPSPGVDNILKVLKKLGLVEARSLDEHHGLSPHNVLSIFQEQGFRIQVRKKFQLGLNNLMVLHK